MDPKYPTATSQVEPLLMRMQPLYDRIQRSERLILVYAAKVQVAQDDGKVTPETFTAEERIPLRLSMQYKALRTNAASVRQAASLYDQEFESFEERKAEYVTIGKKLLDLKGDITNHHELAQRYDFLGAQLRNYHKFTPENKARLVDETTKGLEIKVEVDFDDKDVRDIVRGHLYIHEAEHTEKVEQLQVAFAALQKQSERLDHIIYGGKGGNGQEGHLAALRENLSGLITNLVERTNKLEEQLARYTTLATRYVVADVTKRTRKEDAAVAELQRQNERDLEVLAAQAEVDASLGEQGLASRIEQKAIEAGVDPQEDPHDINVQLRQLLAAKASPQQPQ